MPIPINPEKYLAQVVMRPDTNPESNSFVNTFFFDDVNGGIGHATMADHIEALLEEFYNTPVAPSSSDIASFLSSIIDPTLTVVKVYDLGAASPRVPEIRGMGSWAVAGTALPNEVAAVLSFVSGPQSVTGGTNDKTARGRVYIGPLGTNAMDQLAGDTDVRLISSFITALAAAAERMRDQTGFDIAWEQYSRKDNAFAPVTGGFVNNRFDTQRRRGAESTLRTVW